jgi:hypothetical protein
MLVPCVLAGCPNKDESDDAATTPSASVTPTTVEPIDTATAKPMTDLVPEGPKLPAIEARVKSETDGKGADSSHKGSTLRGSGTKGSFVVLRDWAAKPGATATASSKDGKTLFGTAQVATGADGIATALGLSDCKWAEAEPAKVGKAKLDAQVADGVCKHGDANARAASVTIDGQSVVGMGAWDVDGGNSSSVFSTLRSATKAATGSFDATGIGACCAALRQNANSAPLQHRGAYLAAAGACNAVRSSPQGRAALASVRAMLRGAQVPSSCR